MRAAGALLAAGLALAAAGCLDAVPARQGGGEAPAEGEQPAEGEGEQGVPDDDPRLFWDARQGTAPEVIGLNEPEGDRYGVGLHAMGAFGGGVEATVRIHVRGELAWESEPRAFVDADAFREVAAVDWSREEVHPVDSYVTPAPRGGCD